ncbi:MAG TPA: hypothetical protein GX004_05840 [Firmicutes bacterium]|nr:hypothetical protein [Bacillota bacterium]
MRIKTLAVFILGMMLFMLILYWGLNIAEKGICHLLALEGPGQALQFDFTSEGVTITFAGIRLKIFTYLGLSRLPYTPVENRPDYLCQ